MNNKVLINVIVPELDLSYDVYIPVNEVMWKIKKLIVKSISDLSAVSLNINDNYALINKNNSTIYDNNTTIYNSDIRNGTELILITLKDNNRGLINVEMKKEGHFY